MGSSLPGPGHNSGVGRIKRMCICVDCFWLDRCRTYHQVENQHGEPHLALAPDFVPQDPRIHVSLRPLAESWVSEWDVRACGSFRADPGHWQRLRPGLCLPP